MGARGPVICGGRGGIGRCGATGGRGAPGITGPRVTSAGSGWRGPERICPGCAAVGTGRAGITVCGRGPPGTTEARGPGTAGATGRAGAAGAAGVAAAGEDAGVAVGAGAWGGAGGTTGAAAAGGAVCAVGAGETVGGARGGVIAGPPPRIGGRRGGRPAIGGTMGPPLCAGPVAASAGDSPP